MFQPKGQEMNLLSHQQRIKLFKEKKKRHQRDRLKMEPKKMLKKRQFHPRKKSTKRTFQEVKKWFKKAKKFQIV